MRLDLRRLLAAVLVVLLGGSVGSLDTVTHAGVTPLSPTRLLDTRIGLGAPARALAPGEVLRLMLPGVSRSGETVALLNLTSDRASAAGHVSAWACDEAESGTSVLNFVPGRPTPNMAAVRASDAGICLAASASTHLIADLTAVTTEGDIHPASPHRVVDSRMADRLIAGREYRYRIAGTPGTASDASGAALNVTVVHPSAAGWVRVTPCGTATTSSTVNFHAGDVVAHFTLTELGGGDVCVTSLVDTHLVVDTFGWVGADSDLELMTPNRILDTRRRDLGSFGALRNGDQIEVQIANTPGVRAGAETATVNIAAVNGTGHGHVTAWPCDTARPETSVLNLWPQSLRANQATLALSSSGRLCLAATLTDASGVDLVVDVVGASGGTGTPPPRDPSPGRFETLPVGASLPSGEECAALVRPAAEIRPANAAANQRRGSRSNANTRTDWWGYSRVDGAFSGTTDEIIQWAACKWGIDEDMVRAQIVKESWWTQSVNGDNGESWGLGQVRVPYHGSAFEFDVNARTSSAYNLDYTYAVWRSCFEGSLTWLNQPGIHSGVDYGPGDAWGCFGVWFSGRWYTPPALAYLEDGPTNGYGQRGVKTHYRLRTWEDPAFLGG